VAACALLLPSASPITQVANADDLTRLGDSSAEWARTAASTAPTGTCARPPTCTYGECATPRKKTIDRASTTPRGLFGYHRPTQPHPAVVRVTATQGDIVSHGSGTLVGIEQDHGMVITNWHVVREATDSVTVAFPDGYRSPARVLQMDRDWDLAALLIWRPQVEPVPIANHPPQPGDRLTIAGYGSGSYREATGYCTQYVAPGLNLPFEMVELSAQARQGDSGGPIFNEAGEVAGVLFGAGRGTTSGSYAGRVRKFLADVWRERNETEMIAAKAQEICPPEDSDPYLAAIARKPSDDVPESNHVPARREFDSHGQQDRRVNLAPDETFQEITWEDLAGDTLFQQAKSLFAMIGVVVVLIHMFKAVVE